MGRRELRWFSLGLRELEDSVLYWETTVPRAGARALDELENVLNLLAELPGIGRPIGDLPLEYRQIFAGDLRVTYRIIGDEALLIISVRHKHQLPLTPEEILRLLAEPGEEGN